MARAFRSSADCRRSEKTAVAVDFVDAKTAYRHGVWQLHLAIISNAYSYLRMPALLSGSASLSCLALLVERRSLTLRKVLLGQCLPRFHDADRDAVPSRRQLCPYGRNMQIFWSPRWKGSWELTKENAIFSHRVGKIFFSFRQIFTHRIDAGPATRFWTSCRDGSNDCAMRRKAGKTFVLPAINSGNLFAMQSGGSSPSREKCNTAEGEKQRSSGLWYAGVIRVVRPRVDGDSKD